MNTQNVINAKKCTLEYHAFFKLSTNNLVVDLTIFIICNNRQQHVENDVNRFKDGGKHEQRKAGTKAPRDLVTIGVSVGQFVEAAIGISRQGREGGDCSNESGQKGHEFLAVKISLSGATLNIRSEGGKASDHRHDGSAHTGGGSILAFFAV